ncbi:MAG: nucleotidyltransferase domain-containing protein [Proteobacteria bacterium]|nr:nucleotidyltransferase domain-containing protein [Pseudomonadota bacterium]MBU1688937.1 nucleotidyltransferase domain-containing protein [Pseudomonadota bacterium]
MVSQEEIIKYLAENKSYLYEHFHLTQVGLFGSFSRGDYTENSDIDLMIELRDNTPNIYELKNELRTLLQQKFGRQVDIAREKYLKEYVKKEIMGEVIYVE